MASDLSSFASLQLIDSTESSNTSSSDTSGRSDGDSSSATNRSGHGRLAHRSGLLPETPRNGNPGKRRRRTSTVSSTHIDQTLTAMQSPAASESSSTFRSAPIVGSQSIAAAVATPGSVSSSSSAFPFSPDLSQSQATVATTPSNDVGPAWSQPIQNSQSSSRSIGVASVHSAQGTPPGACKALRKDGPQKKSNKKCPMHTPRSSSRSRGFVDSPSSSNIAWRIIPESKRFRLSTELDVKEAVLGKRMRSMLESLVIHMQGATGKDGPFKRIDVFELLASWLLSTHIKWTNVRLRKNKMLDLSESELMVFIAMYLFLEMTSWSFTVAISHLRADLLQSLQKLILTEDRYNEILGSFSAQQSSMVDSSSEVWDGEHDHVKEFRKFETEVLAMSRQIMAFNDLALTIDDELIGSRAGDVQSKTIAHRKAGKEGLKNDAIAESTSRVLLAVKHRERIDYSQDVVVESILSEVCEAYGNRGGSNIVVCADRGYSKPRLWGLLLDRRIRFHMIADCAAHPFKVKSKAKHSALNASDVFEVDDNPRLGPAVFRAEGTVGTDKHFHAAAFRDYSKDGKTAVVIRFVESGVMDHDLWSTISMTPRRVAPKLLKHLLFKSQLFVSAQNSLEKEGEDIVTNATRPLTILQRTADWAVLRQFRITGTGGHNIAKLDPTTHSFLFENANERFVENHEQSAARHLFRSWVFSKQQRTSKAMRTGHVNEGPVTRALRLQKWCIQLFEVGLLMATEHPWLAVSPDGIAKVHPPGNLEHDGVWASVEIKTRVANQHLSAAEEKIVRSQSKYIMVSVNDDFWWALVKTEHRGQVIHQAMVLQLDYVLYCVAKPSGLLYVCLVHVPSDVRRSYFDAIEKWKHLATWVESPEPEVPGAFDEDQRKVLMSLVPIWTVVNERVLERGPLAPVHRFRSAMQVVYNTLKSGIDGNTQYVAQLTNSSRNRLAFHQLVALRAIKQLVVNSFVIFRCITVAQQQAEDFQGMTHAQIRKACSKVGTLADFTHSLVLALFDRASLLVSTPQEDAQVPHMDTLSREQIDSILAQKPKHRKGMVAFFNNPEKGARVRLNPVNHMPLPLGSRQWTPRGEATKRVPVQKVCAYCGAMAAFSCSTCTVPLHVSLRGNQRVSCFVSWHQRKVIPPPESNTS
eukprot:CAMPEP_0202046726 /NCGR_PEP_ID=MMETSP0963-20130614/1476_1 /ASSEMBLY_ACC=CAM_ASM_000494 /TAXON_ID=4773 /ORGANISM="Schizochytrium aggregatum, Strain ATCC28209" /LENGTH=1146 /DNA_ID=CAMNT_0048611395 /DNA_START=175 /DNA_END=3614 /DNA_ORIENTATION=+